MARAELQPRPRSVQCPASKTPQISFLVSRFRYAAQHRGFRSRKHKNAEEIRSCLRVHSDNEACAVETHAIDQPLDNFVEALLLRVYINPKLIRKVKLTKIPESVEHLKDELREELELEELGNKHLCLKEPGSGTGYDGWATSIKYKLGNYRSKLRQAGCNEVSVNRKRRPKVSPGGCNEKEGERRGTHEREDGPHILP
ncbi:hypothetical protein MHYP_G00018760 [Metynnis hypsauchen]